MNQPHPVVPDGPHGSVVPVRPAGVASAELDGEAVLLDGDTGSVHLLDPMATIVWACFDGATAIDELVGDLSDAFGADVAQVRRDVVDLARDLGERGLLVEVDVIVGRGGDGLGPEGAAPSGSERIDTDEDVEEPRYLQRGTST